MAKNETLHKAKEAKNDEFYTQMADIQTELNHTGYQKAFIGKTIYCNCDDPEESNFWKYFKIRFKALKLKELISTHYEKEPDKSSYVLRYDGENVKREELAGNGDFRSEECIELLKTADVVVTNPPFSLFREYVAQLEEYKKKFIIIGNKNAITYKEFFPLIKENKVWIGYDNVKEFKKPDGTIQKFGNIGWYTNIDIDKRHENIELTARYNDEDYPEYDNYNAINVDRVNEIPRDYKGVMGVPITFLDKYNPEQFEIVNANDYRKSKEVPEKATMLIKDKEAKITVEVESNKNIIPTDRQTFAHCSKVTQGDKNTYKEQQIFVKNGYMYVIDGKMDNKNGSAIIDTYNNKQYETILGEDGVMYDLLTKINYPSNFKNKDIIAMTSNIENNNNVVLVYYANGKVYGFNYVTGEEVYDNNVKDENVNLANYILENLSTANISYNINKAE